MDWWSLDEEGVSELKEENEELFKDGGGEVKEENGEGLSCVKDEDWLLVKEDGQEDKKGEEVGAEAEVVDKAG